MWWRLWDIAAAGNDHELELLILPGPRLRPGTRLPDGFPFQFVGLLTRSWSSVAILLAPEIADCVRHLSTVGDDRRLWFLIQSCDGALPWLLCAVYGPPGGDVAFWSTLLAERSSILCDERCSHTIIAGDANIHLSGLVNHPPPCSCCHCKQSGVDAAVECLLRQAGFVCWSPPDSPTHASGTIIDLVLSDAPPLGSVVAVAAPGCVALSDHGLVSCCLPVRVSTNFKTGFGRVAWSSSTDWDDALADFDPHLQALAAVFEEVHASPILLGLASQLKQRRRHRAILDACVWLHDAWYAMIGHLAGLVRVRERAGSHHGGASRLQRLPPGAHIDDFHTAVQQAEWSHRRRAVFRYLELRAHDQSDAARYLSRLIAPP